MWKFRIKEFRILDLFSGAGGFSYGMEQNCHFKTIVALDFNEPALKTFKHNISSYLRLYDDYRVLHYNTILFQFCQ